MAEPTTTTKKELEIIMSMQNVSDANDYVTKTLTLDNPNTTTAGMSAIADFRAFMLTDTTVSAAPGLIPAGFFQPTNGEAGAFYKTVATTANIVETTKTVTPIE